MTPVCDCRTDVMTLTSREQLAIARSALLGEHSDGAIAP